MSRQRAIVIDGSMSGMLAARVLANHFADVVLFDRDAFPQRCENRRPRLEAHVRCRLTALPNVRLTQRADVESLAIDNGKVTGVNVRSSTGDARMVTLFGMLGEHPPSDEPGFLDFARSLPLMQPSIAFRILAGNLRRPAARH